MQTDQLINQTIDLWLAQIHVVLVNTSHPGNIGGTARAMKNMGLKHLTLVNPVNYSDEQAHQQAVARASGAEDILANATLVPDLDTALSDCVLVMGTSARNRHISWPLFTPKQAADKALQQFPLSHIAPIDKSTDLPVKIALVFGTEKSGLTNEDLHKCHAHIHIPTQPNFSSLNLAAAVQVMCYQLRYSCLEHANPTHVEPLTTARLPVSNTQLTLEPAANDLATNQDMELMFAHLHTALTDIDFLDVNNPRQLMTRLRRLFMRAQMDKMEVNIIRGILTASQKATQQIPKTK